MSSTLRLVVIAIFLCFTTVFSFNCSEVLKASNGFRITVDYPNGTKEYRINNKLDTEWTFTLKDINDQIIINFDEKSAVDYNKDIINKIGLNDPKACHPFNCIEWKNNQRFKCKCPEAIDGSTKFTYFNDPLIFKANPKITDENNTFFVAYNKKNKNEVKRFGYRLEPGLFKFKYIKLDISDFKGNIPFVDLINSLLFSQIDSIVEFDLIGEKGHQNSGHLLWFFISKTNYYCVQPYHLKHLSEECSSIEKLRIPFSECIESTTKTTETMDLWIIVGIIIILILVIVVAIGGLVWYRKKKKRNDKDSDTSETSKFSEGSITASINRRRKNSPMRILKLKSEELNKEFTSPKGSPEMTDKDESTTTIEPTINPKVPKTSPKKGKSPQKHKTSPQKSPKPKTEKQ